MGSNIPRPLSSQWSRAENGHAVSPLKSSTAAGGCSVPQSSHFKSSDATPATGSTFIDTSFIDDELKALSLSDHGGVSNSGTGSAGAADIEQWMHQTSTSGNTSEKEHKDVSSRDFACCHTFSVKQLGAS